MERVNTFMAVISERWKRVDAIEKQHETDRAEIVRLTRDNIRFKEQLHPMKALTYGAVGLILAAVVGALVSSVLKGPPS
jgi:hypothetical protein